MRKIASATHMGIPTQPVKNRPRPFRKAHIGTNLGETNMPYFPMAFSRIENIRNHIRPTKCPNLDQATTTQAWQETAHRNARNLQTTQTTLTRKRTEELNNVTIELLTGRIIETN